MCLFSVGLIAYLIVYLTMHLPMVLFIVMYKDVINNVVAVHRSIVIQMNKLYKVVQS